jgi:hypothetical protein
VGKPRKYSVGDVFTVPVGSGLHGYGQIEAVLHEGNAYWFAIFEPIESALPSPEVIDTTLDQRPAFFAKSTDALLQRGDWQVIGNYAVRANFSKPAFKSGEKLFTPDERYWVVDVHNNRRKPATPDEVQLLENETSFSPKVLQLALEAYHGLHPWWDAFDKLRIRDDHAVERFFPSANASQPQPEPPANAKVDEAVIVHFKYGSTDVAPINELADELGRLLEDAGLGDFDGHELAVDGSDVFLYMYGPSADQICAAIVPVLESRSFTVGAHIQKRVPQ